jgi:hypothetical protein
MWFLAIASCTFRPGAMNDLEQVTGDDAATGDACPTCLPSSCKAVREAMPAAPSGVYTIDLDGDGPAAAFEVACDMSTMSGGWTLVGLELVGAAGSAAGPLRLLGIDSMNSEMIATGTEGGVIGARFTGAYGEVLITWGLDYLRFSAPSGFEMFGNVLGHAVPIDNLSTSDQRLAAWVAEDGGAILCIASRSPDVSAGNSSWAIKPSGDNETGCGCNSTAWYGRGAYYGGASQGEQTICNGWGGGWAGVKGHGEPKAGLAPTVVTRLWIR